MASTKKCKGCIEVFGTSKLLQTYRQFVKDFAKIAKPLHEIMRKKTKWS